MTSAVIEKTSKLGTTSAVANEREKLGFNELKGTTGPTLHVSETKANYRDSKAILEKAGLEFFTRQEILLILTKDEKLKESLKGKWFYIAGEGLNLPLTLYTIDDKGELVERKGSVSPEMTVRVWNGKNPLYVGVLSGGVVAQGGGRFGLLADDDPDGVAPVVVGKAKAELKPEQLAKQLFKQAKSELEGLLRLADRAEKSADALKAGSKPELIEPIEKLIRFVKQLEIKD